MAAKCPSSELSASPAFPKSGTDFCGSDRAPTMSSTTTRKGSVMAKAALIAAPGCEEGETLTIVDMLRRAEIEIDMVGLGAQEIAGTHHITVRCDTVFDG